DVTNDPIAQRAADAFSRSGKTTPSSGTSRRSDNEYAEVAVPVAMKALPTGGVLLLTASVHDAIANVDTVQRRLLEAGGLAPLPAPGRGPRGGAPVPPPDREARGGGRADRRRPFRRAGGRHGQRRAGAARAGVRSHAPAPGAARARPARVRRQRVARVADAAL